MKITLISRLDIKQLIEMLTPIVNEMVKLLEESVGIKPQTSTFEMIITNKS